MRLTPSGDLDASFGTNGRVVVASASNFDGAAITADGTIVLAGTLQTSSTPDGSSALDVMALTRSGQSDASFGRGGAFQVGVASGKSHPSLTTVSAVAVNEAGQILVAGAVRGRYAAGPFVARFDVNGLPDGNFGQGGVSIYPAEPADRHSANLALGSAGLLVWQDGSVVVPYEGSASPADDSYSLRAVKFGADGSVDSSFGSDGVASVSTMGRASDVVGDMFVEDTGGILASIGSSTYGGNVVKQIGTDGSETDLFNEFSQEVATDPQERILLTTHGDFSTVPESEELLARYLPDGSNDPTFGDHGVVVLGEPIFAGVGQILPLPDSSVLVEWDWSSDTPAHGSDLTEYSASGMRVGSVDTSVGEGGIDSQLDDFAVTLAGKVLVLATVYGNQSNALTLTEYNADMTVDTAFGAGGTFTDPGNAGSIAVAPNGDLYVSEIGGDGPARVIRLKPDGTADSSFGAAPNFAITVPAYAKLMVEPDGKLVVAEGSPSSITVTRYNTDGSLDTTFGNGGVSTITFGSTPTNDEYPLPLFAVGEVNGEAKLFVAGAIRSRAIPTDAATGGDTEGFIARIDL